MPLLQRCFCFSLRQGSFIIGTYSLIVYCIAFAIELWWIAETLTMLPAPTYALCALYFFNFVTAAVLLFGLLVRQRKYLMSWTLTTALSFFPEAGMVLFMSLYFWPTQKYEYGVVELVYWSIRAIFNIFGALCVCSLYLSWRDEQLVLERLNDLNLTNLHGVVGFHTSLKRRSNLNQSRRGRCNNNTVHPSNPDVALGYQNFGYKKSEEPHYLSLRRQQQQRSRTSRSFTSAYIPPNQQSQQRRVGNSRPSVVTLNTTGPHHPRQNEFNPAFIFDPTLRKSRISEWGIAGVGIEPPGYPGTILKRSKSLWNVGMDDYWTQAPPSRPVSMGYVNHALTLADNTCDTTNSVNINRTGGKRWNGRLGGRRAASMDGLNHFYRYYNQNIMGSRHLGSDWSMTSVDYSGDEDCNYGRSVENL